MPTPDRDAPADRQVYRSAGPVVAWWAWLAFAAASLATLAAARRDHAAVVTAAVIVAITGLAYACALRPRIVADDSGLTMVNPLREHAVPWSAVAAVDLGETLRVRCAPTSATAGAVGGKILHSWAVQSPPRSRMRGELRARRSAQRVARGTGTRPGRDGGSYARLADEAKEALAGTHAEFVARQLAERAARQHQFASQPGEREAGGGMVATRWAWDRIAAMVLPLLAVVIIALT